MRQEIERQTSTLRLMGVPFTKSQDRERDAHSSGASEGSVDSESWTDSEITAEWDVPGTPQSSIRQRTAEILFKLFSNSNLDHTESSHAGGSSSSDSGVGTTTPNDMLPSTSASSSGVTKRDGKRKREDVPNDDEDDNSPGMRQRLGPSTSGETAALFACPFYKKDRRHFKSCGVKVLRNIPRVKFHLLRCHQEPIHCDRCFQTFESDAGRREHLRQDVPCNVRSPADWHAINEDQKKQLAQRISRKKTARENWYEIYKILFGDHDLPKSPYLDGIESQELRNVLAFAEQVGPRIVEELMVGLPESVRIQHDDIQSFLQSATQDFVTAVFERWEAEQRRIAAENMQQDQGLQEPQAQRQTLPATSEDSAQNTPPESTIPDLTLLFQQSASPPSSETVGTRELPEGQFSRVPLEWLSLPRTDWAPAPSDPIWSWWNSDSTRQPTTVRGGELSEWSAGLMDNAKHRPCLACGRPGSLVPSDRHICDFCRYASP